MKKTFLGNLLAVSAAALVAVVLTLSLFFAGAETLPAAEETEGISQIDGSPVAAVSILDLAERNVLTRAHYVPDVYVAPGSAYSYDSDKIRLGAPIDLEDAALAERGTLQFVFLNVDSWAEDFDAQTEVLAPRLGADGNWHFSLYLPPIFSACNVFSRTKHVGSAGELADYELTEYGASLRTEAHKDGAEPLLVDLSFPAKRETILTNRLQAALLVTVHYEGAKGRKVGLAGLPVVGDPEGVQSPVARDRSALSVLLVVSALAIAVFVFLCFLKRTLSFLPQPLMALGVFGALLSAFVLTGKTASPYAWQAVGLCALSFLLLAAVLALRVRLRKRPVWLLPAAFALANCVVALTLPFFSFSALSAYLAVANAATGAAVLLLSGLHAKDAPSPFLLVNPVLAGVTGVVASCYPATAFAFSHPALWLFALMILVNVIVSFREFVGAETRNRYLTANLSEEVARQTGDLQEIIAERDKILLYVSHDMKKPVAAMDGFLLDLRQKLTDEALLTKVDYLLRKNGELKRDFTELGRYGKREFLAEPSEVLNACDLVREVCEELRPDCEANGILLAVSAPARRNVYAKQNGLRSIVLNLVLNAIEHSRCARLSVTVSRKKGFCRIDVTDDGVGLNADQDPFEPYRTDEAREENCGLGLYLARSAARSMGGDLTCEEGDGRLTFTVTVPLA